MVVDLSEPSKVGPIVKRMRAFAMDVYGGGRDDNNDDAVILSLRDMVFGRAGFWGLVEQEGGTAEEAGEGRWRVSLILVAVVLSSSYHSTQSTAANEYYAER